MNITRKHLVELRNVSSCSDWRDRIDYYLDQLKYNTDDVSIAIKTVDLEYAIENATGNQKTALEAVGVVFEKPLPTKWEDLIGKPTEGLWFVHSNAGVTKSSPLNIRIAERNTVPTKELAEAILALTQLLTLRDIYNNGWVPMWEDHTQSKWVIKRTSTGLVVDRFITVPKTLAFKNDALASKFFTHFKDLLQTAAPLL